MGARNRIAVFVAAWAGLSIALFGIMTSGHETATGAPPNQSPTLQLTADPSGRRAFEPVDIRVAGAAPGSTVTLAASATDAAKAVWTSTATFRADAAGGVDLAKQAPLSGTYHGVDEMGLLWSMNPPRGSTAWVFSGALTTTITATDQGLTRTLQVNGNLMAGGETVRPLTVAHDGFEGHFYRPAPGTAIGTGTGAALRPAVITLGGSEGGEAAVPYTMALAAEGYPALSVGYFDEPGTPSGLKDIPLEYFARAATWLAKQPGVADAHILVLGGSRGSEAALLTAQNFPSLVHGALLFSPGAEVDGSYPDTGGNAWTLHGRPVADPGTDIPVNRVDGPVLAFAGDSDRVWSSATSALTIMDELNRAGDPYPHKAAVYAGAGHFVDAQPYVPVLTTFTENGTKADAGGARQADAAAQGDSWQQVLKLLAGLAG